VLSPRLRTAVVLAAALGLASCGGSNASHTDDDVIRALRSRPTTAEPRTGRPAAVRSARFSRLRRRSSSTRTRVRWSRRTRTTRPASSSPKTPTPAAQRSGEGSPRSIDCGGLSAERSAASNCIRTVPGCNRPYRFPTAHGPAGNGATGPNPALPVGIVLIALLGVDRSGKEGFVASALAPSCGRAAPPSPFDRRPLQRAVDVPALVSL
jgi:hypothetical protein